MEDKNNTPWRKYGSPDPFLTLSNLHFDQNYTSGKKGIASDRFMNEAGSIKCRLNFEIDSQPYKIIENNETERPKKKS